MNNLIYKFRKINTIFCPYTCIQQPFIAYVSKIRRQKALGKHNIAIAIPSVRQSVCPSVTRRYCVKTTALSDSKMCLVLYKPKNIPKRRPLPLKSWLKLTYPLLKAASFDTFCLVAP